MKRHLLPVFLIFIFASVAVAQPSSSPSKYHGHVFYDNGDKAENITVKAVVDNTIRDSQEYSGGVYELVVERGNSENFTEVSFVIDNIDTGRTASFEAFGSQQVNFTIPAPETGDDSDSTDDSDDGSGGGGGGGFTGANFADEEDNEKPVAGFTWDTPVRPGESVTMDASGSFDPDGNISEYRWSIGARGETVENVFGQTGSYSVTLTVEDDEGASTDVTKDVVVSRNRVPRPSFEVVYTGSNLLQDVRFNASESYDPDGEIVRYEWNFGEVGETASQSFQESRNVTLIVVDNEGGTANVTKQLNERVPQDTGGSDTNQITGQFVSSPTSLVFGIAVILLLIGGYILRKKDLSRLKWFDEA